MIEIIAVSFRNSPKSYYFSPGGETFCAGDRVVVETSRGQECGKVCQGNHEVSEEGISGTLKPVLRRATPKDLERWSRTAKRNRKHFKLPNRKLPSIS